MSAGHSTIVEVRAALSQAVARVLADFYGKGPSRTRSYVFDDYVFAVAEDVLTPAEAALLRLGDEALVQQLRVAFEDVMANAFVDEVERILGRTVVGYHSQVLAGIGCLFESFVLDPKQPGIALPASTAGAEHAPGEAGDADALPAPGEAPPPTDAVHAERPRPSHGELRAAIGAGLGRACQHVFGRGPARARAYLEDRYVFCALENPLTRAEVTLAAGGRQDLVRALRQRLVAGAQARFTDAAESLLGAHVVAVDCQVVFDPDVMFLVLVLDADVPPPADVGALT